MAKSPPRTGSASRLLKRDDLLEKFVATSDEAEQKDLVNQLQKIYSDNVPAIPLFPGPQWGEFNTARFTGFPNEDDPYALLSTYQLPRSPPGDGEDQAGLKPDSLRNAVDKPLFNRISGIGVYRGRMILVHASE